MTSTDWVRQAASLPLDGVELYWPAVRGSDDDALDGLRRTADDLGLALPMMCASPDFIQHDQDRFESEIAEEARAIRATATLGGKYTRILEWTTASRCRSFDRDHAGRRGDQPASADRRGLRGDAGHGESCP